MAYDPMVYQGTGKRRKVSIFQLCGQRRDRAADTRIFSLKKIQFICVDCHLLIKNLSHLLCRKRPERRESLSFNYN